MAENQKIARIYLRVSTAEQDLARQEKIVAEAKLAGYYVACVYRETASGARADRPELLRMIADLQRNDVVIAERMDRLTRLPLDDAERLIESITSTGAVLAVPGVLDLSQVAASVDGVAKILLAGLQEMFLKITLQLARENYELMRDRQEQGIVLAKAQGKYQGRKPNLRRNQQILAFRQSGKSIAETARLTDCSLSHVKSVCKASKQS